MPALETPMIRFGASVWHRPGAGRFYRSVVSRYAEGLRQSDSRFRQLRVAGASIVADVTEFTTLTLYFGNTPYEPATSEFVKRMLPAGGVFVDVGANHGYFSLLAASWMGDRGRVFAFEPNPSVYAQLDRHVRLNCFDDRVTLLDVALWDTPGEGQLFVSQCEGNSGLSSLVPSESAIAAGGLSAEKTVAVRTESFDRWLSAAEIDRVDLVKIDAEGAELQIVRGMVAALRKRRVRALVCETEWNSEAHRLLCESGFVPRELETTGRVANIAYVSG
jgi:FkbM family methyltransferase